MGMNRETPLHTRYPKPTSIDLYPIPNEYDSKLQNPNPIEYWLISGIPNPQISINKKKSNSNLKMQTQIAT